MYYHGVMKMRMKPLRGKRYETNLLETVVFLERTEQGNAKVLVNDALRVIDIDDLMLPIIDTKDYEKIADEKRPTD